MSMKKIYRKIAKEHGVTVAEVKRDMQEAINYAHENKMRNDGGSMEQGRAFQMEKAPTPDELIMKILQELKSLN